MKKPLLEIKNLSIYRGSKPLILGANFRVGEGEVVGLFGESGVGKSVFSLFLLGLLNNVTFSTKADVALFNSNNYFLDMFLAKPTDWNRFRSSEISMVFQDPTIALNPTLTCGKQVEEVFYKTLRSPSVNKKRCLMLFGEVGLVELEKTYCSFPHELSGGQKQRVVIAIALASNPKLLIADEPTTSLDPSVQRGILDLILKLKKKRSVSVVLISHKLDLIKYYCDNVYVLKNKKFHKILNKAVSHYITKLSSLLEKIKTKDVSNTTGGAFSDVFYSPNNISFSRQIVFDVKNLSVCFLTRGDRFYALKNVSLRLRFGDVLGFVGESGSGKTTLGRVLCGIEKNYSGFFGFPKKEGFLKNYIQMVYQDPFSSFNPKYTVGESVSEIINLYKSGYVVGDLFSLVGLVGDFFNKYPHELSGGQKQRVSIARVLASNPSVIIFDESLSALDIETQYSILNLIRFINTKFNISVVFISHDINSVYYLCDKIIVLRGGAVVDCFYTKNLFGSNRRGYTKKLITDSNFL